jgi:hypothetical protein
MFEAMKTLSDIRNSRNNGTFIASRLKLSAMYSPM